MFLGGVLEHRNTSLPLRVWNLTFVTEDGSNSENEAGNGSSALTSGEPRFGAEALEREFLGGDNQPLEAVRTPFASGQFLPHPLKGKAIQFGMR